MLGVFDKDISESFDQLFSKILKKQQANCKITNSDPEKVKLSKEILDHFSKLKGRGFVYNYLSTGIGHGPFTKLVDGSTKYDLISSIGVNILGHSHPIYIKSFLESALSDTMMCGNLLTYQESYQLTETILKEVSMTRLKHFWFAGSGSFANDTALKILWQKQAPKKKLIAFEKAFAGRSIATQDITFDKSYREGMPESIEVYHVPHFDQSNPTKSLQITLEALNKLYLQEGDNFCALMIEIIQGEAGFVYGTKEFYEGIFKWAQEKGIYIWIDEVQTFMRTTELFAFQMFELDKYIDIVTVGKALQTCGVLYTEALNPKPGLIAGTFNGSIASLKAGRKAIELLRNGDFYGPRGRIKNIENDFIEGLTNLKEGECSEKIGYIGGVGTMISFEVGDSSSAVTRKFLLNLFENGIIAFSAGKNPTRVRFLLPVCLTKENIEEIFSSIKKTINQTI